MGSHKHPKFSSPEIMILVLFALFADALNWIPILNWLIGIVSIIFFQSYYFMKGVKIKTSKYSLGCNIFEFTPFLSALPATTVGVVATIIMTNSLAKKQEKIDNIKAKEDEQKIIRMQMDKQASENENAKIYDFEKERARMSQELNEKDQKYNRAA